MSVLLREMCILSVLAGALLAMSPEGAVKKVAEIAVAAVLMGTLLGNAARIDLEDVAACAADSPGASKEISDRCERACDELNRLVIAERCRAYIIDKARALGIEEFEAELELRQGAEGAWMPWSAEIRADTEPAKAELMMRAMRDELGIAYERQTWS